MTLYSPPLQAAFAVLSHFAYVTALFPEKLPEAAISNCLFPMSVISPIPSPVNMSLTCVVCAQEIKAGATITDNNTVRIESFTVNPLQQIPTQI